MCLYGVVFGVRLGRKLDLVICDWFFCYYGNVWEGGENKLVSQ